jgi:predicted Zn-dependent peptidase
MNTDITVLDNGLRVAVDEMESTQTVCVAVFVNTGSRNETESNNGVSHFLEHMAFKGTKTRNSKQIAQEFDDIGGRINAYTSRERTVYYAKVLKKDAKFATEFLADILQNSTFDEEELEKERGVILQEIAMTNDTPDDIIFDYFQQTAFPNQALGRSILGPEDNVKKFKSLDLKNYIDKQYNNSNIAVVASGNIKREEFIKYVEDSFGSLSNNKIEDSDVGKYKGGYFKKEKDLEQTNLILGFNGISYNDDDFYKCQMLASVLGGGMSSRLFQEIREKRGLCYSIYAFNYANIDSGSFGIYSATNPKSANELIKVTLSELNKITKSITDEELDRSKSQMTAGLLMSSESNNNRSQKLGNDILSYGRIRDYDELTDEVSHIDKEGLMKLADKIFSSGALTFSAIGAVSDIVDYESLKV